MSLSNMEKKASEITLQCHGELSIQTFSQDIFPLPYSRPGISKDAENRLVILRTPGM